MPNSSNKVILEIGSGSFKLHLEDVFSKRFQSSLGKDLGANGELAEKSVEIALDSLHNGNKSFQAPIVQTSLS